jgi:hypothetical protein
MRKAQRVRDLRSGGAVIRTAARLGRAQPVNMSVVRVMATGVTNRFAFKYPPESNRGISRSFERLRLNPRPAERQMEPRNVSSCPRICCRKWRYQAHAVPFIFLARDSAAIRSTEEGIPVAGVIASTIVSTSAGSVSVREGARLCCTVTRGE